MNDAPDSHALHNVYPWLDPVWQRFSKQLTSGRLHHALLLSGISGCGKRALAFSFVSRLLCDDPINDKACGACKSCLLLLSGTHPGLMTLSLEDTTKQINVDQIRSLINFSQHTQMKQGARVVMLHPAESMNRHAANAILKCLEEPQPNMYFILVSDNPGRLLPTVRSRCQSFTIVEPVFEIALNWLMQFENDRDKAINLLKLSEQRPLLAKNYFEDGADDFYLEMRTSLTALSSRELSVVGLADKWSKNAILFDFWIHWLLEESKSSLRGATSSVTSLSAERLHQFIKTLLKAKKQSLSTANPNRQLLIESLLIDWQVLSAH